MNVTAADSPWYVLRAETGRELRIADQLAMRDFEAYVPYREESRQWSRRKTEVVRRAFFPGYVFARFDGRQLDDALQVPGVIDVLKFGRTSPAATVDHSIIDNVRLMALGGTAEALPNLMVGSHVTVRLGPFAGVSGILSEIKNKLRVVVNIEILRRALAVEVDRQAISAW